MSFIAYYCRVFLIICARHASLPKSKYPQKRKTNKTVTIHFIKNSATL